MYIQLSHQEVADMIRKKFPGASNVRVVIKKGPESTWYMDVSETVLKITDKKEADE